MFLFLNSLSPLSCFSLSPSPLGSHSSSNSLSLSYLTLHVPILWNFLEKALTLQIVPPMLLLALLSFRSFFPLSLLLLSQLFSLRISILRDLDFFLLPFVTLLLCSLFLGLFLHLVLFNLFSCEIKLFSRLVLSP